MRKFLLFLLWGPKTLCEKNCMPSKFPTFLILISARFPDAFNVYARRDGSIITLFWSDLDPCYDSGTVMVNYTVMRKPQGGYDTRPKTVKAIATAGSLFFAVQSGYTYQYDVTIVLEGGRVVFNQNRINVITVGNGRYESP